MIQGHGWSANSMAHGRNALSCLSPKGAMIQFQRAVGLGFVRSPRWGLKAIADGILKLEIWCVSRFSQRRFAISMTSTKFRARMKFPQPADETRRDGSEEK